MHQSNPIIICEKNSDFRILLREIFTKNGHFHILETSNPEDVKRESQLDSSLICIVNEEFFHEIYDPKNKINLYLYSKKKSDKTANYVALLGEGKVLTHPLSSSKLLTTCVN